MTLKRFFQIVVGVVAILLLVNSVLVLGLLSNQEKLNQASRIQNEAANMLSFYRMVNEITVRLIRQYAITGDEKARQQYDDIIDVVYGKKPWPTGKTLTAGAYMRYLGFPKQALEQRDKAIALAAPVYELENIAYHAMQGKFKGSDGEFTVKGDVDQQLAIAALHSKEYQSASDKMQPIYEKLMQVVADDKQRQVDELYQASVNSGRLVLTFIALSIAMLLLTYWQVNRRMLKPLQEMLSMTESVAQGDLTVSSSATGSDEVGRFGAVFNQMVRSLEALMLRISATADAVNQSANGLAGKVDEARLRSETQQRDTDQVAVAINEMAATAQEVAHNSANTSNVAHQVSEVTSAGHEEVTEAVKIINKLADTVHHSSKKITELEQHADNVSNVLNVIQGIAEQTNLLALNAAIEAARAGEQGRGFAVVADEVRTLAQRTQDSTNEIQITIEQLMMGTKNAVTVMQSNTAIATEAVTQAQRAGSSLDTIAESVEQIDDMSAHIATAAKEQSAVVAEVDELLTNIRRHASEALDSAAHTSASAVTLSDISADLQLHLSQFTFKKS
ncbi:methyl-accepting chemotaxis protein [Dasania sp. GY-19]|uniref:Methyl-accepting chemotaxis protein n=1 Tax=Dasania phycosphaerae TaxID=2950436 RepID=A0A9J6RQW1_9GAMM|nr:methyl-accepting chemotaxis protein [Dasania phycosphaerae]MCZ0867086.1 methyl-accepting chemotaxis protein [Dasania phycosphaerae]